MKKQSEAEWLGDKVVMLSVEMSTYRAIGCKFNYVSAARRLLAALKRRGWTSPKPTQRKGKK